MIRAVIITLMLVALVSSAYAVPWTSAQTTGVTRVVSQLDTRTSTFTWTLTNLSGTPFCSVEDTVIVWWLQPFNVPTPISYTAPSGWTWDSKEKKWQNFEVAKEGRKYYTPPALGPGKSITFTYRFDPNAPRINPYGAGYTGDPNTVGFIAHVAAVVGGTGTFDGSRKWVESASSLYGDTWYDRSPSYPQVVPEPYGMSALILGACTAIDVRRRVRK